MVIIARDTLSYKKLILNAAPLKTTIIIFYVNLRKREKKKCKNFGALHTVNFYIHNYSHHTF